MSEDQNPLISAGATFLPGAATGLAVFAGAVCLRPETAALAFDWLGDDLDLADGLVPAWLLGQAALIVHHILPGIAWA